jgi:starch synthase
MSDAVSMGHSTINNDVLEYAKTCGKPFLEYHNMDTYVDAYSDFYDKILFTEGSAKPAEKKTKKKTTI